MSAGGVGTSPPPTGGSPPVPTVSPRDLEIAALLRQVSLGLGAYRLFPGDLDQVAFVGAVRRIADTVERAVSQGPVHVEVLASSFRSVDGDVPNDQHLERLARNLYGRRVEHLHIHRPPSSDELAAFYRALTVPEAESIASGGVQEVLAAAGVTSISAGDITPDAGTTERPDPLSRLDPAQLDVWRALQNPDDVAASLLLNLRGEAADSAAEVYNRLRSYGGVLPDELTGHPDFIAQLNRVVEKLPAQVRREVTATLVSRAASDAFAEQYIGNMTDAELARTLVALSEGGGPDPVGLARRVADLTGRRDDVVTLTESLSRGDVVAGQVSGGGDEVDGDFRSATADLMSSRLLDRRNEDVQAILELFPLEPADWRALALLALQDYLGVETDLTRLRDVLEAWSDHVRDAIARDDLDSVDRLLAVTKDPRLTGDAAKHDLVTRARDAVLTPELLSGLLEEVKDRGADLTGMRLLLSRFGTGAVDGLFEAIAHEPDRGSRALMVSLLGDVGGRYVPRVAARLADDDWHVVRNAVTVLGRIGGDQAREALQMAATHREPKVRREVLRSLSAVGGAPRTADLLALATDGDASVRAAALATLRNRPTADAAHALVEMVRGVDDVEERRRVITALGQHRAPEAPALLRDLGSWRTRPRLPRPLRRHARLTLRTRAGGAS